MVRSTQKTSDPMETTHPRWRIDRVPDRSRARARRRAEPTQDLLILVRSGSQPLSEGLVEATLGEDLGDLLADGPLDLRRQAHRSALPRTRGDARWPPRRCRP